MIKSSTLIKRKDGMSVEDFQRYWREKHGPVAGRVPGLRRYIQCQTLLQEYERETPPDYDGVEETWWDDVAAFERAKATAEYQATTADMGSFVGESMQLLEDEVSLKDAYPSAQERQAMVKYIAMLFLKEGVPIQAFQSHWKDVHGPINVQNLKGMKRYVQSHVLPAMFEGPNPPPFGGLPEAWFDSVEAMRRAPRDPNARRDTDWPNFCSGQRAIFTKEIVIVA
jgi:uncharacterized protein (TIGR02118 family)